MKCFAIVVKDNKLSEAGFNELNESYKRYGYDNDLEIHYAIEPDKVEMIAAGNGLHWNYPWEGSAIDIATGLTKTAYPTADKRKRISCFLSHWYLWNKCEKSGEMIMIFEHDARIQKKLPSDRTFRNSEFDIIGINDPSMATRKSKDYHDAILENTSFFQPVPVIDEVHIPQGLAGNSAYVIKPKGAERLLDLSLRYGMWPNDALMCRQLVPNLGVTRNFYTRVQGLRSTTTL
jgi:hypothetical protein|tara:strand:- start:203 stop:901 length:699 start_codon:yes stop_codon:yes gene_type:complete